MSSTREQELTVWLNDKGYDSSSLSVLSADAIFRQYYRVNKNNISYAVMDCPSEDESLDSFLKITEKLQDAKLNVPEIFDCDSTKGFLVITDFGNDLYSKKLNDETVYCLYTDALEAIVKMQTKVDCTGLLDFDNFYEEENNLFIDWFLNKYKELSTLNEIFSNLEISNKISQ